MTEKETWLANLKAGDEVVIDMGRWTNIQICKVDRTTPSQIIIGMWRFRRPTGVRVGDNAMSSNRATLVEPTDGLRARIERIKAAAFINGHKHLEMVPLELLTPVVAALKAMQA